MENPRVRLKYEDYLLLDIGLWDIVNFFIFHWSPPVKGLEKVDLYLNGEKIEKPIYEEDCNGLSGMDQE